MLLPHHYIELWYTYLQPLVVHPGADDYTAGPQATEINILSNIFSPNIMHVDIYFYEKHIFIMLFFIF